MRERLRKSVLRATLLLDGEENRTARHAADFAGQTQEFSRRLTAFGIDDNSGQAAEEILEDFLGRRLGVDASENLSEDRSRYGR